MDQPAIGFIGLGEAGYIIARDLRSAGVRAVAAYDIALETAAGRRAMEAKADEAGITLLPSLAALAEASDLVVSAVVTSVALSVARTAAPDLAARHIYIDLNSTSPAVKREIGAAITATRAPVGEAAVMAAVPPLGHKVPILLCGAAAGDVVALLMPFGMTLEDFGPEIGAASAAKMFRSIISKGLEALLLECAIAAGRYGVTERVLDYVGEGYPGIDWNRLADYLIGRTAIHGERRAHEMAEVAETLKAMDIEPIMARAAAERLQKCAALGLKSKFGDRAPASYHSVIRAIEQADGKGK